MQMLRGLTRSRNAEWAPLLNQSPRHKERKIERERDRERKEREKARERQTDRDRERERKKETKKEGPTTTEIIKRMSSFEQKSV